MPTVSISEYRRNFLLEMSRMAAIQPDQLGEKVPHLDGWTVRTVVEHVGTVLRFASLAMAAAPDELPAKSEVPSAPKGPAVLGWMQEASQLVVDTLDTLDLSATCPTWIGPQTVSWYLRRLTHEVSVHRWDAQVSRSVPDPIDVGLAVDGIDELLEVYVPRRMNFGSLAGNGETIHLHATDHKQGEWLLTLQPDQIIWERSHTKADVAARGTASELLLLLWGRRSPADMEIFGDETLLTRWKTAASF